MFKYINERGNTPQIPDFFHIKISEKAPIKPVKFAFIGVISNFHFFTHVLSDIIFKRTQLLILYLGKNTLYYKFQLIYFLT